VPPGDPRTEKGRGAVDDSLAFPRVHDWLPCAAVKTSLTGIKPTHGPHLGNYLGAIRPALELEKQFRTLYFIADYHALTTVREAAALRTHTRDVAAVWLASGLDPAHTIFFKQSAVPEVFELGWVLSCLLATGQLERGHAYKDAVGRGESPNAGIFNYPVLMAADILLYDTNVVPIGQDQKQHLELCRDVALRLNHLYGEGTLVVPDALITDAPLVPGTDGLKMSKSKGNAIPLFAPAKELRKAIMGIVSGSEPLEAPKDPDTSTVYLLYKQVAPAKAPEMAEKLRAGGYGWGHAKQELFEAIEAELGPKRTVYEDLRRDEAKLDALLEEGAEKARAIAHATMKRVREAVGVTHR
jgi:tryptophanyl-tRNA synthetase